MPDAALPDVAQEKFDVVVIPGGDGGAKRIAEVSGRWVGGEWEVLAKHSIDLLEELLAA